jgi:hypothetical protein
MDISFDSRKGEGREAERRLTAKWIAFRRKKPRKAREPLSWPFVSSLQGGVYPVGYYAERRVYGVVGKER